MKLYSEIKAASKFHSATLEQLIRDNFKFLNFLPELSEREFAIMRICEFIKRDCDKVLIAETEDKEIVGTIFFSSKFSKKSLLTAKAEINERTGIETRTMFNNLINIRNLANIYKFELNERKQKYVFVDYILD